VVKIFFREKPEMFKWRTTELAELKGMKRNHSAFKGGSLCKVEKKIMAELKKGEKNLRSYGSTSKKVLTHRLHFFLKGGNFFCRTILKKSITQEKFE
jgi:hypothetical protein